MCTALWQRKRAQRCDSDGADSNVTALTVTALGHQWLRHRCDSDVYISVTAMVTDTAVTAVTTDSAVPAVAADTAVTAMCTLVWQRCQLPLLSQWCAHCCHTNVHIAVTLMWTLLSVVTAVTLVCTVVLQCCRCHCYCTVVSLHRWYTVAAIAITVLSLPCYTSGILSPLWH